MLIQQELKAPKGQYNSFGKYHYRSCEDILEAIKPITAKYQCVLTLSDSLEQKGARFYVCAIAKLTDIGSEASISNTAYAREEDSKKGMDGSQITGTASSYARKYALNGLFCIDDTKDADTDEYRKQNTGQEPVDKKQEFINAKQQLSLKGLFNFKDNPKEAAQQLESITGWKLEDLNRMPVSEYSRIMNELISRKKHDS